VEGAIIFDLDGTLLDSAAVDETLYKRALEDTLGPVRFRVHLGAYDNVTDSGILLETLADNDIPATDELTARTKDAFVALLQAFIETSGPFPEIPGAREIVDRLRQSSRHSMAIATGGWRDSALVKLESAGFDIPDVPLLTSDDAVSRTDIMLAALHSLGGRFASVTYFGDGEWDRRACEQLGWTFYPVGPAVNGLSSFHDVLTELEL
jgi:beta-phosphoglucomutase-like phosphatase (HAD superfamily)